MAQILTDIEILDAKVANQEPQNIEVGATAEQLLPLIDVNQNLAAANRQLVEQVLPTLERGIQIKMQRKEVEAALDEQVEVLADDEYIGLRSVVVSPPNIDKIVQEKEVVITKYKNQIVLPDTGKIITKLNIIMGFDNVEFIDDLPDNFAEVITNPYKYIKSISIPNNFSIPLSRSTTIRRFEYYGTSIGIQLTSTNVEVIICHNLVSVNGSETPWQKNYYVRYMYVPKLVNANSIRTADGPCDIRHLTIHPDFTQNKINSFLSLYDFRFSSQVTHSIDWSSRWLASTALSSKLTSICNHDEFDADDEPEKGFAYNLLKFLWYFEYKFIPQFSDTTEEQTIVLHTNVYNAISSADSKQYPEKKIIELLTDKGWSIATNS